MFVLLFLAGGAEEGVAFPSSPPAEACAGVAECPAPADAGAVAWPCCGPGVTGPEGAVPAEAWPPDGAGRFERCLDGCAGVGVGVGCWLDGAFDDCC